MRTYLIPILVCAACVVWVFAYCAYPSDTLSFYALNVGQGDALFIETPEKYQIVVDGGPDMRVLSELSRVMPFYDRTIDLLVLSHPQADHMFGLLEILKRYRVANVLMTGVNYPTDLYAEFLKLIHEEGAHVVFAHAGQKVVLGSAELDVLYPLGIINGTDVVGDVNDMSLAGVVRYGDTSFLFMGDAGLVEEAVLAESGVPLDIDVLKISHHGSRTSTSQLFLEKTTPEIAVVSVGAKNTYGHPNPDTLARLGGVPLYRTDTQGRVAIISNGEHISVKTEY